MKKSFLALIVGLLAFATLSGCDDENESGGSSSVTTSASIAPSSITSSDSNIGSSSTSSSILTSSSVSTSASSTSSHSITSSTSSQGSSSTSTAPAHVHTFSDEWSFNSESHWRNSTCGHNVTADFDNHDFVDEIISPTHETKGYTHHECTVCGYSYDDEETEPLKCKIQFVDENNKLLEEQYLDYGETPVFHGKTPTKQGNAQYSYTFSGWSPEISTATDDQVYTAQFASSLKKYTIYWKNYDGKTIDSESYDYGSIPEYKGSTPTRPRTAQYSYTFKGWSTEITPVTADKAYNAAYDYTINSYVITWKNDDGTVLDTETYEYGEMPSYKKTTPTKASDVQYSYTFSGWNSTIQKVSCDKTYTARFSSTVNQYNVTWKNDDGTVIAVEAYNYGTTPSYKGTLPSKEAGDLLHFYRFDGWKEEIKPVYGDQEYTAVLTYADAYEFSQYDNVSYKIDHCFINNLEEIELPTTYLYGLPIKSISSLAFNGLTNIKKIVIPSTYENIQQSAFSGCSNIESITSSVFGPSSHYNECVGYMFGAPSSSYNSNYVPASLKEIIVTERIADISVGFFKGCSSLTSITLPSGIERIYDDAFNGCSSLKSIVIPDTVIDIGSGILAGCTSLESLTIPFIGDISEEKASLACLFGASSYSASGNYIPSSLKEVIVTNKCTAIGDGAFYNLSSFTNITIPENVSSIGKNAFYGCSSLESINLPETLSSIGDSAFYGCSSLKSVQLPEGITSLGDDTFYKCSSLESVNIPEGVTSIGSNCFRDCGKLKSISFPSTLKTIKANAFYGCSSLTTLILPDSVAEIGQSAFRGCNSLISISLSFDFTSNINLRFLGYIFGASNTSQSSSYIPTSLKEITITKCSVIPSSAFQGCVNVTKIILPDKATSIGKDAFKTCTNVETLKLPFIGLQDAADGFEAGGNQTLAYIFGTIPSSLARLEIGNECTKIGRYALKGCSSLTSLIIPKSVTSIGYQAFFECASISEFVIHDTIRSVEDEVFPYGKRVNLVYSSFDNFNSGSNCAYRSQCDFHLVDSEGLEITNFEIPYGATSIKEYTFSYLRYIKSVSIPETVTEIKDNAFIYCFGLESIVIPGSVVSIGYNAFKGCSSLKSITLSEGLNTIYSYAFSDVPITSIELPNSLANIGSYAFYNCKSLTSIEIPSNVESLGDRAFNGTGLTSFTISDTIGLLGAWHLPEIIDGRTLYVYIKVSSVENFLNMPSKYIFSRISNVHLIDSNGNEITELIVPNGVTSIPDNAFCKCRQLKSIILPESVTSIGTGAFSGCSSLQSIDIPNNVSEIGGTAFSSCSSLQSVAIPNGVVTIEAYTFYNCSSLVSIEIPESVTTVGHFAFAECSSLSNIILPDSIDTIGDCVFLRCNALESVVLPAGITYISSSLFDGCTNLQNINIPSTVTLIGECAFRECASLLTINIPNNIEQIQNIAFGGCSSLTSVTIPKSVTEIEYAAFINCLNLTSVTIEGDGSGEIVIFDNAFKGCTSLCEATFGEKSSYIIGKAFVDCTSLASIELPEKIECSNSYMAYISFKGCTSLKSIRLTEMQGVYGDVFDDCTSLEYIIISTSVKFFYSVTFANCDPLLFYEGSPTEYAENGGISGIELTKLYFYSEEAPTEAGNYWHYVDGVPTIW